MQPVAVNTSWQLGDGPKINFWHDKWLSLPIVELLNSPASIQLNARVTDFIFNNSWSIPQDIRSKVLVVYAAIIQMVIPLSHTEDQVVWHDSDDDTLTLKRAYEFLNPPNPTVP